MVKAEQIFHDFYMVVFLYIHLHKLKSGGENFAVVEKMRMTKFYMSLPALAFFLFFPFSRS